MGSKPKAIVAPTADYAADIRKFVSAYGKSLPQVLGFERQFRPEFQALNLQDISSFLSGAGGQQGLYALSSGATQEAGQQLGAAREAELGTMAEQAPLIRGVMEGLSPEQAAVISAAQTEAERALAASQGVTPQERRVYEQQAREQFQTAGRLGGNLGIVSEAMGREDVLARKRAEAAQAGQNLYGLAQGFYTQPGLGLLSQQPISYQTGQQMLGLGMGGMKQGTPGLINPDTGLNLGAAERQNQLQAASATQQARASYSSGLFGGLGALGGGLASGIGAAGGAAAFFSDRRLKTDIEKVGKTNAGLPIYTYKYKGDNKTQMGVMAQDVEKKTPKAVKEVGGFKAVNYALVK
jgi:hypothetical protein